MAWARRRPTCTKTLLSLGRTTSHKADKPYLIGVFRARRFIGILDREVFDRGVSSRIRHPQAGDSAAQAGHRARDTAKGRRDPYFAYLAATEDGAVPHVDAAPADKARLQAGRALLPHRLRLWLVRLRYCRSMYQSLNHVLFNPVMPYELFALKVTPEPMMGTATRPARRAWSELGRGAALDKSFAAQPVI